VSVVRSDSELEARVVELETLRREDVVKLQRAQESLANTQVELMEATRKLKAAEERARGGDDQERPRRRASEPVASSLLDADTTWSSEPENGLAPAEDVPTSEAQDGDEDQDQALPDEALSLRERLARAAAARHRTVAPHD
jgi:hypothetical protein